MSHSRVWNVTFIRVTNLDHICDMSRSNLWHVSFICVYILVLICFCFHQVCCRMQLLLLLLSETHCNTLHHTATHCNTLQHTATHCNHCKTLQHTATHCNTLQHSAPHCATLQHTATHSNTHIFILMFFWFYQVCCRMQFLLLLLSETCPTATHCITLHHTASHCITLHYTALHCTTLHHTATHCNTLQHTATHCNHCKTLQHTAALCNSLHHTATHCNTLQHTPIHIYSFWCFFGIIRCIAGCGSYYCCCQGPGKDFSIVYRYSIYYQFTIIAPHLMGWKLSQYIDSSKYFSSVNLAILNLLSFYHYCATSYRVEDFWIYI